MGVAVGEVVAVSVATLLWLFLVISDERTPMHEWFENPRYFAPWFIGFGLVGALAGALIAAAVGGLAGAVTAVIRRG